MAQMNVAQFAKELGLPASLLLEQLQAAGVNKQLADDTLLRSKTRRSCWNICARCTAPRKPRTRSR